MQGLTSDISGICFMSQNENYGEKLYLANDGNFYVEGRDAYGRAANINPLWLKSLADTNLSSYKLDVDVSFANLENGLFNLYTNWNNSVNMPANYGSGMIIPFLDSAYKMHIYGDISGNLWQGVTYKHSWRPLNRIVTQGTLGTGIIWNNGNICTRNLNNQARTPICTGIEGVNTELGYGINSMHRYPDSDNLVVSIYGIGNRNIALWSSDERLKKNIVENNSEILPIINNIKTYSFDFKNKHDGKHTNVGLIAQQLQEHIPEAVIEVPQDEDSDYETVFQIDANKVVPYLIKSIQELSAKVDELNKKLKNLDTSSN